MGSLFVNKSTQSPGEGGEAKKIRRYVDEPSAKFDNTKYASQINVQFATDSTPMFTWGIRDVRVLLQDPDDVSFSRWSLLAVVWNSSLDQGLVLLLATFGVHCALMPPPLWQASGLCVSGCL